MKVRLNCLVLGLLSAGLFVSAQTPDSTVPLPSPSVPVPHLIRFSGVARDLTSKPLIGVVGITFGLYQDQQGGAPLWVETQNVQLDASGHYSVQLGATKSNGIPTSLFTSAEARWLGVQISGQAEQARVLLLSVPYALKAADAETVGGLPPSAFIRATPGASAIGNSGGTPVSTAGAAGTSAGTPTAKGKVAPPTETQNYVAKFINSSGGLGNSLIFDNGKSVGIGTTAPGDALDVVGAAHVDFGEQNNGTFANNLAFGIDGSGEAISSSRTGGATNQYGLDLWTNHLRRVSINNSGNVGIGTAIPRDALDVVGTAHVDFGEQNNGTFANNLVFGVDGSGEAISSSRTGGATNQYGLDLWTNHLRRVSINNSGNVGIGTATPAATLDVNGVVNAATGYNLAGSPFLLGSNGNAFLGFAGNSSTTGTDNTASGYHALAADTTGSNNTASGYQALPANTTGNFNTVAGYHALYSNTIGSFNTGVGRAALYNNNSGNANTAIGHEAGQTSDGSLMTNSLNTFVGANAWASTGTLANAAAIGAQALVSESNALVLGSISGVNGATASVNVGIGTTAPAYALDVNGNGLLFNATNTTSGANCNIDNNGNLACSGIMSANSGFSGQCLSSGAFDTSTGNSCNMDLAEAYASAQATEPGDLVALLATSEATVRKSTKPYETLLLGVVSTNPGLVFDNGKTHLAGDNSVAASRDKAVIALAGRVPVKVSMENGPIRVGDPLTSSSHSGVAMKAMAAGKIIGYALAPATKNGKVLMFVQPGYYAAPQLASLQSKLTQLHRENLQLHRENANLRNQFADVLAQVKQIRAKLQGPETRTAEVIRPSAH
jgi:hypothetical protein